MLLQIKLESAAAAVNSTAAAEAAAELIELRNTLSGVRESLVKTKLQVCYPMPCTFRHLGGKAGDSPGAAWQ